MTLLSGARLGSYEILAPLGAGGMGEVYRASDSRLGREVAIKILPEGLARNPERLGRFEREARVLASLNHPNIAAIYGFEQANGVPFLVLEYVPGQTLKGPLPVEEALAVAIQITEGLEAAHEKGIVHRDLKPANIKMTPEGKVKVLDFGLAKALSDEPSDADPTRSPTLSALATRAGTIMGTAAYMSPEQARGRGVDRRTDIWAFGCVLYEMLVGKQAFPAETVSDAIAGILAREPDWKALPAETPERVRQLLRRCLEKELTRRLRHIDDARIELGEAEPERFLTVAAPKPSWLPWGVAVVFAVAMLAVSVIHFREKPPAVETTQFVLPPPEKASNVEFPAISPDGRRLAFAATAEGKTQLWVRPLDSLTAHPLAGTDDASFPFWSPDSRFLGFFAQGKLKKVDASGGPPQMLCDAATPGRGGAWNRDGVIVFGGGTRDSLRRVSSAGGVPSPLTTLESAELSHRWPQFLPDDRHFLYFKYFSGQEKNGIYVAALDSKPQDHKRLFSGSSMAVYTGPASGSGHLLFERDGTLMAQAFDLQKLELRGEPFPVTQQLGDRGADVGWAAFSASSNGTIAYRTGAGSQSQLTWFDRAGKRLALGSPEEEWGFNLAPDEKRAATVRRGNQGLDIWVREFGRDSSARFTFHPGTDYFPVWSPDGSRIVFASTRAGPSDLFLKISSGASEEELLLKSAEAKYPTDWSPDGRHILYQTSGGKSIDLWVLPLTGDRKPFPYLQGEFNETLGQFSPDGRWVAYVSNESQRPEIYVQAFPKPAGKWMVSTNGGHRPRWRGDGKELFYLSLDRKLMAVDVKGAVASFEAGQPRELFQTSVSSGQPFFWPAYDVTADGKRFLINAAPESAAASPITVIENWMPPVTAKK